MASTKQRLYDEARRMVASEKFGDLINDPREFIRRLRIGYYSDRLIYVHRWLVNDEQQQINEYYGIEPNVNDP